MYAGYDVRYKKINNIVKSYCKIYEIITVIVYYHISSNAKPKYFFVSSISNAGDVANII